MSTRSSQLMNSNLCSLHPSHLTSTVYPHRHNNLSMYCMCFTWMLGRAFCLHVVTIIPANELQPLFFASIASYIDSTSSSTQRFDHVLHVLHLDARTCILLACRHDHHS